MSFYHTVHGLRRAEGARLASAFGVLDLVCPYAGDRAGRAKSLLWTAIFTYVVIKEIDMTEAEARKFDTEIAQLAANTAKLNAETANLLAETRKLTTEARWYLLVVGSGATLAIVAMVKLFL